MFLETCKAAFQRTKSTNCHGRAHTHRIFVGCTENSSVHWVYTSLVDLYTSKVLHIFSLLQVTPTLDNGPPKRTDHQTGKSSAQMWHLSECVAWWHLFILACCLADNFKPYAFYRIKIHKNLDSTLCLGSTWCHSIESEAALYSTSGCDISLYYRLCFWHQNSAFVNVSLKTHVFSANMS